MVFHRNPNLSDERDLERLRFLPPDDDLERLRFCLLSGEEEGERDLFRGEEPFPDLELDLERDLERDPDLELDELLERDLKDKKHKTFPIFSTEGQSYARWLCGNRHN